MLHVIPHFYCLLELLYVFEIVWANLLRIHVDVNHILGTLFADYCPNVSGCRSIIEFTNVDDMKAIDLKGVGIRLTFNSSRPVWLVRENYLLVLKRVESAVRPALCISGDEPKSRRPMANMLSRVTHF